MSTENETAYYQSGKEAGHSYNQKISGCARLFDYLFATVVSQFKLVCHHVGYLLVSQRN